MEENLEKKIQASMGKLENEIIELKDSVKRIGERSPTSKSPVVESVKSPTSKSPVVDNVKSHLRSAVENDVFDNLYDVQLTQISEQDFRLGTQENLQKALNGLSQDSFVSGFDQTQPLKTHDPVDWWTPMTLLRSGILENAAEPKAQLKELKLSDSVSDVDDNPDSILTFVPLDEWYKFCDWASVPVSLNIGPTKFDMTLAKRIIGPKHWLGNEDMDAVMYLFRENISLRRWEQERVAFMPCLFSLQINSAWLKYLADKKRFILDNILIAYGNGELPSHGRTDQVWGWMLIGFMFRCL